MKIICTICSSHKSKKEGFLPARLRYSSDRIKKISEIAKSQNTPFFILSGKYGLIFSEDKIPIYDHLLKLNEIDFLTRQVEKQLKKLEIDEINFYYEDKEGWLPYKIAIEKASVYSDAKLNFIDLN